MSVTGPHAGVDPALLLSNPPVVHHGSRGNARTPRVFSVAAGCILFGCLPLGIPPVGEHVIADRTLTGVYLSPSEQDGVPSHLLVTGPAHEFLPTSPDVVLDAATASATRVDLYAVPYADAAVTKNGLSSLQPAVGDFFLSYRALIRGLIPSDSLGRLIVVQFSPALGGLGIVQVDLAAGGGAYLGAPDFFSQEPVFLLSSTRSRVFVGGKDGNAGNTGKLLCDIDGCLRLDDTAANATFLGEDLYYVDRRVAVAGVTGGNLSRARPRAEPEVLLSFTGTVSFQPIVGDRSPQLLLSLATDTGAAPFSLLDTDMLTTASLPAEKGQAQFVSASSDGHWLAFVTTIAAADASQPDDHRLFLYDWTSGGYASVDSARVGRGIGAYVEWRPGHSELWFSTLPDGFGIWRADAGLTVGQANLSPYRQEPDGKASVFTRNGRHWFSADTGSRPTSRPTILVGSADDPTAPLLPLNPRGTVTTTNWETDDGRLLVGVWTLDANRKDIYLVDADAGTSRTIATAGHLAALGHNRALALLNWEISRATGDLTLIDLASGAHTLLAQDVYDVAVDRGTSASVPPGTDALAPGTRVAFLTNNRLASPWDGLWVASLP
jgi:hypothetical protein